MTIHGGIGNWLIFPKPVARAKHRLFCFPFAGGGASAFDGWADLVPGAVEVVLVQPPGRESRLLEPSHHNLVELVRELVGHMPPLDIPFSFYGHSMGAFIAFELCRQLRRETDVAPTKLFVSASRAPQVPDPEPPIHVLPDAEFLKRLVARYDAIPPEVLSSAELMALLLPKLKADLELVETYSVVADETRIPIPIYAYAGGDDAYVDTDQVARWSELTTASFDLEVMRGGHFFLSSQRAALLASISSKL